MVFIIAKTEAIGSKVVMNYRNYCTEQISWVYARVRPDPKSPISISENIFAAISAIYEELINMNLIYNSRAKSRLSPYAQDA